MPNEGFKGSQVRISKLSFAPGPGGTPVVHVDVQFVSDTGDVHAIAAHNFITDPEVDTNGLAQITAELFKRVTALIEHKHFSNPHDTKQRTFLGIAESLRSMPAAKDDEPGTQG